MGTGEVTVEELEAFWQRLQGPLGEALRETGIILERRLRNRGVTLDDLTDDQLSDAFVSAFMEAAPKAYPHIDQSTIERALAVMAGTIRMELAATVSGGCTRN